MECATCYLTDSDLPPHVDPESVFVRRGSEEYCRVHAAFIDDGIVL